MKTSRQHWKCKAHCALACVLAWLACPALARAQTVVVNEYFGMNYRQEPVSFDIELTRPAPVARIGLNDQVSQVEILEGTPEAVRKARIWTLVDFDGPGQQVFTLHTGERPAAQDAPAAVTRQTEPDARGLVVVANEHVHVKIPADGSRYARGTSAFELPGPVVAISRDGQAWFGSGYLDSMLRLEKMSCQTVSGPVYFQSLIRYEFEGGKTYTADVRLFAGKPYVTLTEDFNLGGNSRFVFNFDDWQPTHFFAPGDSNLSRWKRIAEETNPTGDFIRLPEQHCLARLVIWSQFNYFGGKQETLALKDDPGSPEQPGPDVAVGAFYIRPDLWTRAKINHVDLYIRPETPGDRMTRGVVGLAGAQPRIAMEAWLVEGHRRWAIFAVSPGQWGTREVDVRDAEGRLLKGPDGRNLKRELPAFHDDVFFAKAHVQEGVWPLDRINRLSLAWNSDASPVSAEQSRPPERAVGGTPGLVLRGTRGRAGLQAFNGSEGRIRGTSPPASGWDGAVTETRAGPDTIGRMVETAMTAYLAADDSAYPSMRAMLPWTHPEAINPFYQGMENMNFNADLYRYVATFGLRLGPMGHPEARRFIEHGEKSFDMALDRYVYPQSGCWEESHGYAAHTIRTVAPLAVALKNSGWKNFFDDPRFARMLEFFIYVYSPRDAAFGNRVVPPVGDHGLSRDGPAKRFERFFPMFVESKNPEVQRIVRNLAWMIQQDGGAVPATVQPEQPDLRSRWLQGYGAVLRAFGKNDAESFAVLRAGQSWGHHHEDKGSLWFWGRNVHFFGDADWGAPPGGTYWNKYKQGPAGGTQIEFVGVSNWTLPCKFAAPWISDELYGEGFDYANARCLYPYNPRLDLSGPTPVALRNGYDRQVLFVHPDVLIVRDNVETVCPTVWRLHSYQPQGTTVNGPRATLASAHGVTGQLAILYPSHGVQFEVIDRDDLNDHVHKDADGNPLPLEQRPRFKHSVVLKWDMPHNTSATWMFGVHGEAEPAPQAELLDPHGRVTRVKLPDGREAIVFLNIEPFQWRGEDIEFDGAVALVIREPGKPTLARPIRVNVLNYK